MFCANKTPSRVRRRVVTANYICGWCYRGKLELAGVTVVLMEEAAQLVEAHALAGMPSSTKRLIMIGDHKQLRPGISTYGLQVPISVLLLNTEGCAAASLGKG